MIKNKIEIYKMNCPTFTEEAEETLTKFYVESRNKDHNLKDATSLLSPCHLKALKIMSESVAKASGNNKVTKEDAQEAIELMKYYLLQADIKDEEKRLEKEKESEGKIIINGPGMGATYSTRYLLQDPKFKKIIDNLKMKNLLFICSANIDRSPAAEDLFKDSKKYRAKSAGVGPLTENPITKELIDWADKIFVMEHEHKVELLRKFPNIEDIIVLGIGNEFRRYDPELEEILRKKLDSFL